MPLKQILLITLCTATLMGCANFAPDYQRPDTVAATAWSGQQSTSDAIGANWWQQFNSQDLNQAITTASSQNTDLRAALQRIEQSRAQVQIARSSLIPSISADANVSTNNGNRTSSVRTYGGGVTMAYEVDLWGRNRNVLDAARNDLKATQFDRDALALIVTSDTAQAYFNVLALHERMRKASDNLALSEDVLKLIQARFTEGAASGQDVAQQNTAIATQRASLSSLQQQLTNAQSQLNVLRGQAPQQALAIMRDGVFDTLAIPIIAPLQPASLLERRPDLAALEEQLKAANLDIGIARANFFPSVTIGVDASLSGRAFTGAVNTATGLVGGLSAPLFTGGRLQGELKLTTARQKELAELYRGSVLTAFQEAENALSATKAATEREAALKIARNESNRYYTIARERYVSGADDFLTLLDAQRTLLQAEDTYIQARLDQLSAALGLFKAMGGGWSASNPAGSVDRQ